MNSTELIKNRFLSGVLPILTIILVGIAVYSNAWQGEFISDDYVTIVNNSSIRNISAVGEIWQAFNTRFLVGLSFALNYYFGQLNVIGYHAVNIFFHLLAALLVFKFVSLTLETPVLRNSGFASRGRSLALYSALIFLCHPIQTEGVAYITQRAVVMATVVYLSTMIFYVLAGLRQRQSYLYLSYLVMFLGLFTKENVITIPLMILVYEGLFLREERWRLEAALKRSIPFFFLSLVLFFVFLKDQTGSALNLKQQMTGRAFNWEYFLTELNVLRTYLRLLFVPVNQNLDYDYPLVRSVGETGVLVSVVLLTGLIVAAWKQFRRRGWLSFAILWFLITTSVEVVVVSFVNRGVIYEHWLYLPMVGFAILLSFALSVFFKNEQAFHRVVIAFVLLLGLLTYQRNFVWQNEILFWEDVVKKSPRKAAAFFGAGIAYQRKEFWQPAALYYQKAIELYRGKAEGFSPEDRFYCSRVYNNLGLVFYAQDRKAAAWDALQQAVTVSTQNPESWNNLGIVAYRLEKYEEAIHAFQRSEALQGKYPTAEYYLDLSKQFLQQNK